MSSIPFTPFRPSNATEAAAGLAIQVTDLFHKLQGALPLETVLRRDEPLARRTTLRVVSQANQAATVTTSTDRPASVASA